MINQKYKLMPGMKTIKDKTSILLKHHRMPGDILTMTPLVRDLKKTYGDQVEIKCKTPQGQEIWQNNPYVTNRDDFVPDETYELDYKMAAENEARGLNMSEGFRQDFMAKSGYHLIASDMWPDIFLTEEEIKEFKRKTPYTPGLEFKDGFWINPFWVICPGNKSSCQVKIWPRSRWIDFVLMNPKITFIQIGQSKHGHKPIEESNVINYIDKTTLRELFGLIYLSKGTIGYASLHMHIAAAFRKPSIVLAGGRESPTFFKYPNHWVINSLGLLPCCHYKGCYKGKEKTVKECCGNNISQIGGEIIPLCMDYTAENINAGFNALNSIVSNIPEMTIEKSKEMLSHIISEMKGYSVEYNGKLIGYTDKFEVTVNDEGIEARKEGDIRVDLNTNDEGKIIIEPSKPVFRMICNATCFGGGERTALRIMQLMYNEGYRIEFIPTTGNIRQITEFINKLPKGTDIKDIHQTGIDIADIVFFQANDTLYRYHVSGCKDWTRKWFVTAKRKIVGINYTVWGLNQLQYDANVYICQSEKLKQDFINDNYYTNKIIIGRHGNEIVKMIVLKPPADLSRFFEYDYSNRKYDKIRLIRHSSQGDRKYSNNIDEQIKNILNIGINTDIIFMPAPSLFTSSTDIMSEYGRFTSFPYNHYSIEEYLFIGNVFFYWVPKGKFIESGCNAVLEAMASGLPILCNDNGGLVDIVNGNVGWLCKTEDQMYEAIRNMTIGEIKKKGGAAKKRVKELTDPNPWIKVIIGE